VFSIAHNAIEIVSLLSQDSLRVLLGLECFDMYGLLLTYAEDNISNYLVRDFMQASSFAAPTTISLVRP
jgi:hypothetical protein